MKAQERLRSITQHILTTARKKIPSLEDYPRQVLDLIIFHKLHLQLSDDEALQIFHRIKSSFVDWNEVRISSIREIQEILGLVPGSLEMAVFIKDLLEFLHRRFHTVDLEFLAEKTIGEIREFLRQIKGMDPTTINMVLRVRKEYPVLPVSPSMEKTLIRLGIVRPSDNRDQKGRYLFSVVSPEATIPFHHFFLKHSREICPPDISQIQCPSCSIRSSCHYFEKVQSRRRRRREGMHSDRK